MLEKAERKIGLGELLQYKSYIKLLMTKIISSFGDSVDAIAYSWMVYILTNSTFLMGSLYAVNFIPNLIFSVFAGVAADQIPKKKLIIIGDMGRGCLVALTGLLFYLNLLAPWHLFVFTFMNSTLESFARPARGAILPLMLPKELFLSGNSIASSAVSFAELMGLGAAGIIIAAWGVSGAFFIDAATFFISAILTLSIHFNEPPKENDQPLFSVKSYSENLKEGFFFVKKQPIIRLVILLAAFVNFCFVPLNVLRPIYSDVILQAGASGVSYMGIGIMLGMVIGGITVAKYGHRYKRNYLIIGGTFFLGLCYSLLGALPELSVMNQSFLLQLVVVINFFFGFSIPFISSPVSTISMEKTPPQLLGRVGSLTSMLCLSAIPFGSMLVGFTTEFVKITTLYVSMGMAIVLASLALLLHRDFNAQ